VPLLASKLPKKEVMKSSELGKDVIRKELPLIPKSPGIYRMIDHKDVILYIGKAKSLPNRLKSYVAENNHIIRTARMLSQTFKLEITTTANESEALLLEANLIKKHKPKFNILLKDDKSFPFVLISNKDQWPQVTKHRGKKNKEGFYFGPFASAGTANWTIKMLQKIFLLRVCDDSTFKNRKRPCMLYQIKRCSGPCVNYINKKDYEKSVEHAIQFVSGKSRDIQKNLSKQMEEASEKLDFERASIFRDRIKSLNIIQSSQRINEANLVDADVIAAYKESGESCIQVFFYRSKQNWGNQAYFPKHDPDQDITEIMSSFLMQFYENKNVPKLIIINSDIKDKKLIEETLSKKENNTISINVAKKGTKAKVIAMAEKNAKESLNRKIYETNNNKNLFEGVSKKFDLKNNISLVEVYDNSHISGTNSVGAMITFGNEGFIKKRYRKFDIKTKGAEQDDFAMLKEVLTRRFKRALLEKGNYLTLPDLILIDGGKGQYSSAKEVLDTFGLHDVPMIAIAKGKLRNSGDETFFYKGKSFKFEKNDPTLFFMQRLRDEAHRFAINSHRAKRAKGITKSLLDQIDGVGSIRKRALLNHFGSARAVESASFDEIKTVEGVEEKVAKKIYNFFHE
jgi:excinuclease ABC subunit C